MIILVRMGNEGKATLVELPDTANLAQLKCTIARWLKLDPSYYSLFVVDATQAPVGLLPLGLLSVAPDTESETHTINSPYAEHHAMMNGKAKAGTAQIGDDSQFQHSQQHPHANSDQDVEESRKAFDLQQISNLKLSYGSEVQLHRTEHTACIRPSLESLPAAVSVRMLSFLDGIQICRVAVVSRKWALATHRNIVWKNAWRHDYPEVAGDFLVQHGRRRRFSLGRSCFDYREVYRKVYSDPLGREQYHMYLRERRERESEEERRNAPKKGGYKGLFERSSSAKSMKERSGKKLSGGFITLAREMGRAVSSATTRSPRSTPAHSPKPSALEVEHSQHNGHNGHNGIVTNNESPRGYSGSGTTGTTVDKEEPHNDEESSPRTPHTPKAYFSPESDRLLPKNNEIDVDGVAHNHNHANSDSGCGCSEGQKCVVM
jgi:hypothetical protein